MRGTSWNRAAALLVIAALACVAGCKAEPTEAENHLATGNTLYRSQDYAGAAAEFEKSLQLDPKQEQKVWDKCAYSYVKAGRGEKGGDLLVLAAAQRTKPGEKLENFRNAAGMYLQANVAEKAESAFLEAMKLDPQDAQSLAWLAEIASARGGARRNDGAVDPKQLETALARYDQLIAMDGAASAHYVNKRIVLARYVGYLMRQKAPDKAAQEKLQGHINELRTNYEATNKKLGELLRAAKGKQPVPEAAR